MRNYIIMALILLCASPVFGQRIRTRASVNLAPSGQSFALMDSKVVAGTRVVYSRSFPIVGADNIAIRTRTRGLADSINIKVEWMISAGDTLWTDPKPALIADETIVSGAGNDTSFVESPDPPTYAFWGRFRVVGRMAGTDSCKVWIDAVRYNKP